MQHVARSDVSMEYILEPTRRRRAEQNKQIAKWYRECSRLHRNYCTCSSWQSHFRVQKPEKKNVSTQTQRTDPSVEIGYIPTGHPLFKSADRARSKGLRSYSIDPFLSPPFTQAAEGRTGKRKRARKQDLYCREELSDDDYNTTPKQLRAWLGDLGEDTTTSEEADGTDTDGTQDTEGDMEDDFGAAITEGNINADPLIDMLSGSFSTQNLASTPFDYQTPTTDKTSFFKASY
ncbi:VP2 [Gyrovirus GyV8]|uniref:Dual specificity protein phosphatase VP2 n=1 Tax=Gyrovirus GyV8 TaxID=1670973 RepID=A0A0G4AMG2_9VIRU|nr:VP2 [Gyrovirus GyV8]AKM76223.1 VP2 [Gyrovirus GyV8]